MIIFFRKVPEQTANHDLVRFIEPALKSSWLRKKGVIVDIKVVHMQEHGFNHSEFHGLVTIEPNAIAEKVIKRLNRKMFLGRHIIVREYHRRVWHNDPRINHHAQDLDMSCRRKTDRRRKNLEVIKDVAHKFSGDKSFHRQHK